MKKALKDICSMIHRGKTPKYVEESDVLVFAQKCNLQKGGIDLNKCLCLDTTNLKKWTTEDYLHKNDIVINSTGTGTLGRVGFFDIDSEKPVVPDTHVTVVRVSDKETYSKWVYYFLKYSQNYLISKGHGSTKQQELATSEIEKIEIPLPSYAYQENGAHHLDSIQSAIDNKKQQLQQLDELVKSKFVEMFGENPVESGKWKVEKLDELCSKISDGVHAKPEYTETGMPFISVVNMNTGKLSFNDCKFVSVEAYEKMIKSTNPEKDDVLYTKVGATYGISALVDTDKKFCLYVSVALLKPLHDKIDSQFLTSTMMMPYVKQQADNSIKGIGVPDLHLNQIRAFKIAVPPIELQNTFAEYVQKIDSAKSIIKNQLADLQELLDSKMDEYFGE